MNRRRSAAAASAVVLPLGTAHYQSLRLARARIQELAPRSPRADGDTFRRVVRECADDAVRAHLVFV